MSKKEGGTLGEAIYSKGSVETRATPRGKVSKISVEKCRKIW